MNINTEIMLGLFIVCVLTDCIATSIIIKKYNTIKEQLETVRLTQEQLDATPGKVLMTYGQLFEHLEVSSEIYDIDYEKRRMVKNVKETHDGSGNVKIFINFMDGTNKLFLPNKFII